MNKTLPLLNWSLKRLLSTVTDSFQAARIRILYLIILFSLLKVLLVLAVSYVHGQDFNLMRSSIAFVFYTIAIKVLLSYNNSVKPLTHIMLCLGILIIWSNIFIAAQSVTIVSLQFVFMAMVSGFYLLDKKYGLIYSILSVLPIIIFLLLPNPHLFNFGMERSELVQPWNLILVLLNFVTLIVAHYIYHQAFSENIAEKESLNLQLQESVKVATKHAQSRSDFLSTMSHELRTPLNSVIGMTDLLLEDPHNKEQKEHLGVLKFSAVSLYTLINDILDFNKLDSDKLQLEKIPVNLYELVQRVCSGLDFQAKEKGLKLNQDLDGSLRDMHVITDPTRILQVMYNLAGNGIKFTSDGSVTVSMKLISHEKEHVQIRFSVTDTGIGISPEKQYQIFEPFVQASSSTTRKYGGTGLGLPIVKRLLTLFGSEIKLESNPGSGSRFYFDIRFAVDKTLPEVRQSGIIDYDLSGLRVLVAEDNPMNSFLIRKLFSKWNIAHRIVENGALLVDELKVADYDLILMDIHMPVMDGYEASKKIRQLQDPAKSNIPIIALTASVSHDLDRKIREVGMNDYVNKPFDAKDLFNKLSHYRKV